MMVGVMRQTSLHSPVDPREVDGCTSYIHMNAERTATSQPAMVTVPQLWILRDPLLPCLCPASDFASGSASKPSVFACRVSWQEASRPRAVSRLDVKMIEGILWLIVILRITTLTGLCRVAQTRRFGSPGFCAMNGCVGRIRRWGSVGCIGKRDIERPVGWSTLL
jgi:hypothetical protein